jgi:flagellar assembly factor FliW
VDQPAPETVTFESARFGKLEIAADAVLEFPEGLIGLGGHRYGLVVTHPNGPLLWLHSLEDPNLALPITNPIRFFPGFKVELTDEDRQRLGVPAQEPIDVYVTVRTGPELADFAANLKAPIVAYKRRAFQILNQAPGAELRAPLFPGTQIPPSEQAEQAC